VELFVKMLSSVEPLLELLAIIRHPAGEQKNGEVTTNNATIELVFYFIFTNKLDKNFFLSEIHDGIKLSKNITTVYRLHFCILECPK